VLSLTLLFGQLGLYRRNPNEMVNQRTLELFSLCDRLQRKGSGSNAVWAKLMSEGRLR
jgi:hypothetical protein